MSDTTAITTTRGNAITRLADRYGVNHADVLETLKKTAFKTSEPVTNEQLMALCIVADQHNLNPWTREIYAFPDRNKGIIPIVGVDGWSRIINDHPQFNGMELAVAADGESCTCTIYRKDRAHPITVTEYMAECKRPTEPWKTHPRRMLRHKALIQCARVAFGFSGIYDPDEGERIIEAQDITASPAPYDLPRRKEVQAATGEPTKVNTQPEPQAPQEAPQAAQKRERKRPTATDYVEGSLVQVKATDGVGKNGQPFTRYNLDVDGVGYSTFDKDIGTAAQVLEGSRVKVGYYAEGNYKRVASIEPVEAEATQGDDNEEIPF